MNEIRLIASVALSNWLAMARLLQVKRVNQVIGGFSTEEWGLPPFSQKHYVIYNIKFD